jgi:hypothetical protein
MTRRFDPSIPPSRGLLFLEKNPPQRRIKEKNPQMPSRPLKKIRGAPEIKK